MKVFFDESGNTGTNWLNNSQPFYVYGGWIIDESVIEFAEEQFKLIFSFSNATEIKSKTILEKNKQKFYEFMNCFIHRVKAIPVFGIADKKYMIAAKITETFFDHEYNPNVNGYLTYRSELKKALADSIFENKEILNDFSNLIARGTIEIENMIYIQKKLEKHFESKGLMDVAKALNKLESYNLYKMIDEFEVVSKNGTEKKWLTLTEPILFDRIINIDKLCKLIKKNSHIYVDELSGYDAVFSEMNEIFRRKGIVSTISKVEQCNSKEEIFIQAADLLSGYINKCFINVEQYRNEQESNKLWMELITIRDMFCKKGIIIWDYYADNKFIDKIGELAGGNHKVRTNTDEIIRIQFSQALQM